MASCNWNLFSIKYCTYVLGDGTGLVRPVQREKGRLCLHAEADGSTLPASQPYRSQLRHIEGDGQHRPPTSPRPVHGDELDRQPCLAHPMLEHIPKRPSGPTTMWKVMSIAYIGYDIVSNL